MYGNSQTKTNNNHLIQIAIIPNNPFIIEFTNYIIENTAFWGKYGFLLIVVRYAPQLKTTDPRSSKDFRGFFIRKIIRV